MDETRAARISSLKGTTAWDDLTKELEEAEERFWKRHIADVKNGVAVDQRKLDFMLGKLDAIRTLLKQPEKASRVMERDTPNEEN